MAQAAYKAIIKIQGTDHTPITGIPIECLEQNGDNCIKFGITDAAALPLSFETPLILTFSGDDYECEILDNINGIFELKDKTVEIPASEVGDITVYGGKASASKVVGCNEYSISMSSDILDTTEFDNGTGYRTKINGILDASVSLGVISTLNNVLYDKLKERDIVLLSINPSGNTNDTISGNFVVESIDRSGDISSLEMDSIQLQLHSSFNWIRN